MKTYRNLLPMAIAVAIGTAAHAAPVIFIGTDINANSTDLRPNANASAAAFDAAAGALGSISVIDFEAAPVGAFANLNVAPGVSLTGSDISSANQTIRNSAFGTPDRLFGYNTTSGGSQFASFFGGSMTFTFVNPVQAFGAYFSGTQLAGETITFSDGSSQTINLADLGFEQGGVQFVGFTDAGKSISSILINVNSNAQGDIVGMDDVRMVASTSAPDAGSSLSLMGLALGALALRKRK